MRDNCRWKRGEILEYARRRMYFRSVETRGAKKDTGRQIDTY